MAQAAPWQATPEAFGASHGEVSEPSKQREHQDHEKLGWGQIAEHQRQHWDAQTVPPARAVDNPEAGRLSFAR
jgi:hypothetical protein